MRINREEMFAPITCVIKADSYDEALALANDTQFGLTAGIMTRSLARATHFRANMRAGCVMVNLPTAGTDYHVPFGGRGASSYGPREQGSYAAEFYTTVKTAYVSAGRPGMSVADRWAAIRQLVREDLSPDARRAASMRFMSRSPITRPSAKRC